MTSSTTWTHDTQYPLVAFTSRLTRAEESVTPQCSYRRCEPRGLIFYSTNPRASAMSSASIR